MYRIIRLFLFIKENLYLKSYFSDSKIRNTSESTRSYGRTWSNISVEEKVGLSAGGGDYTRGRPYR